MVSSQQLSYNWENFSSKFLPLILQHQEELYSLNFTQMEFDQMFYANIRNWYMYGTMEQDCHSALLFNSQKKLIGFYLYQKNKETVYLMQMFVVEEYRGRGYGHMILRHFEQDAKRLGATSSFLHASSMNEVAISFYQRNHYFIMDQEIEEDGMPRFLMFKTLL
ncbi:hypothetical protein BEP19_07965 [Ammoniphilus oxalaticus]|uniref:N-acetyltransferase domain-containing protein n=1 Tax=Ammoniphilus oxalaticus TaxID=66863 RepID=A0A419SJW6_9BACL|nr:GNAT family N-acetyltransferase [Ammoniphilus oxalaticus]RKD24324.1 hypothetical protein BEP19_07965 [Ammoniphilus oxalaticus]